MKPRLIAFAIGLAVILAALLASNAHERTPLLIQADYPLCVTVRPGPLRPARKPIFHPHNSELS